jgi:U32 family peptidase
MIPPPLARRAPELMAPAGDWDCARAAVENGADAVYFGLRDGFNARARAANFSLAELPELMTLLRTRGVKGYLTLNTLVFGDELDGVEQVARAAIAAGIDAILVQDLGLLRLLNRLCPELPLHASTQMTLSSAECIAEVESLGVRRVVLPRELAIDQIAAIRKQTDVELEAFVHGALCISYSGQCLASLSLGGRSANRGQCAQPCRLPYEVVCDEPMTHPTYLLSPYDLAAYDRLPELIAAGVSALKIEGRLKPPEYVASVTKYYRTALDAAWCELRDAKDNSRRLTAAGTPADRSIADMELTFSRGFCHGWLDGPDHRSLVSGESSAKRGVLAGVVLGVRGERIRVELSGPIKRGDGVVFASVKGENPIPADAKTGSTLRGQAEQGGRVYEIFRNGRSIEEEVASGQVELAFRYDSINCAAIRPGQEVWKTDDPHAARRLRESYSSGYWQRRVPLDLTVEASVGNPIRVMATSATGITCCMESPQPLPEARKHPLTVETLRKQFGRLGKTPYELRGLEATLDGRAMIPLSELGKLRHEMVRQLEAAAATPPQRSLLDGSALAAVRQARLAADGTSAVRSGEACELHVLCRSMEQIEGALECGVTSLIADFRRPTDYGRAVAAARRGGASILLATPRIQKPGGANVFRQLAEQKPNGLLVRNLAGLAFCRQAGLAAVADFSLNAVNDLTVEWLLAQGARRVTAAYDLSPQRLLDLAACVPSERVLRGADIPACPGNRVFPSRQECPPHCGEKCELEVVVHRHTPMFHSEYCLFCGVFSSGKSRADCGRPCERHAVRLRDRMGVEHVLLSDDQCRNTLFHAEAQSLLDIMPGLQRRGVRHFRVELLTERNTEEVRRTLAAYRNTCSASKHAGR